VGVYGCLPSILCKQLLLCLVTCTKCKDATSCYRCSMVFVCVSVCVRVCVSVCLLDATTGCAIVVGPVEMLFGVWTGVGPGNHVLSGGLDPSQGKGRFGAPIIGILRPVIVSCDCLTGV